MTNFKQFAARTAAAFLSLSNAEIKARLAALES